MRHDPLPLLPRLWRLLPALGLLLLAACSQRPQAFELLTRDCRQNDPILRQVWSGRGEVPAYVAWMCDCMTDHVVTRLSDDRIGDLIDDGQPSQAIRSMFEGGRPICTQKALQIALSHPLPMPLPQPRD
jgi:hypothetical protein